MVVNSIAAPPDPKRDAKAAVMVKSVPTWPLYTLKQAYGAFPAGTLLRGAPSSKNDGTRYRCNNIVCECPDYQQRGYVCKHVRAIILYEAELSADGWSTIPESEQASHAAYRARLAAEPTPKVRRSYADLMDQWEGNTDAF